MESVDPLAELPGGAVERSAALDALVRKVVEAPRSAWGFDFPFALPDAALPRLPGSKAGGKAGGKGSGKAGGEIGTPPEPGERSGGNLQHGGWQHQLDVLASLDDPDRVAEACRDAAGGSELRRPTDVEAHTPFSPYDARMIEQTYHGMIGVLGLLRGRDDVAILPLDPLPGAGEGAGPVRGRRHPPGRLPHIYVMEVCPVSLLRELELDSSGYEGTGEDHARRRESLLRRVIDEGLVRPMSRGLRRRIVDDAAGDGLDAVLAAVAAWRGTREYDHGEIRADPRYAVQGFVYR